MGDAFKKTMGNDRLKGVELQLSGLGCKADRQIIANHLKGNLVDHFGDHGVDLAGHDRGASLHGGQIDFPQARPRAG